MSKRQLQASLAYWRRVHRWNEKKRATARKHGHHKAAHRYGKRLGKAVTMINRRKSQLEQARPIRDKAMDVAESLIGVTEQGGNNVGPIVSKIIRAAGGVPGEPWCGDMVIYCYTLAGSRLVQRSWAAVRYMLTGGVKRTTDPQRGDIVRFKFDHTGLFDYWSDADGNRAPKSQATHVASVDGNTGGKDAKDRSDSTSGTDGVHRKVRAKSLVSDYLRVTR